MPNSTPPSWGGPWNARGCLRFPDRGWIPCSWRARPGRNGKTIAWNSWLPVCGCPKSPRIGPFRMPGARGFCSWPPSAPCGARPRLKPGTKCAAWPRNCRDGNGFSGSEAAKRRVPIPFPKTMIPEHSRRRRLFPARGLRKPAFMRKPWPFLCPLRNGRLWRLLRKATIWNWACKRPWRPRPRVCACWWRFPTEIGTRFAAVLLPRGSHFWRNLGVSCAGAAWRRWPRIRISACLPRKGRRPCR
jgi:hypothetical protein